MTPPSAAAAVTEAPVSDLVRPGRMLEADIRAFLREQLGRVLPADPRRGLDWYYDWVVLGPRSLEAFEVLSRHRPDREEPVLDVGSGLGTFVLLANRQGLPAIGVEPGAGELALARRRAAEVDPGLEARLHSGRGERLPIPSESASAVLLHDVLEHVADWRAVLGEAKRVLVPGGVAYVKGPSYTLRLVEPHYRLPWLPMMPKPLARRYLRAMGRDACYLDHIGYRRRGEVVAQLRHIGFELAYPRLEKLASPEAINRPWARRAAGALGGPGRLRAPVRCLAENNLQWAIDVVARRPPSGVAG